MKEKLDKSPWLTDLRIVYGSKCEPVSKFNGSLQSGWLSILIVSRGTLEFRKDGIPIMIGASQLYAVPDTAFLSRSEGQLRYCLVSCTIALAISCRIANFPMANLDLLLGRPGAAVPLSRAELRQVLRLTAMLREKIYQRVNADFESEIIGLSLNLLFYECSGIFLRNAGEENILQYRAEKIAFAFAGLVEGHARLQHDISFYAGMLCISPAYLRKSVRLVTGRPARYFIESALMSEAYLMLADAALSISEVSYLLNFKTLFSFSTFFKKHAGLTPTQYRIVPR